MSKRHFPFDYYIRSVTTAVLALIIVGSGVWSIVIKHHINQVAVSWVSGIIGVYFGYHISRNGSEKPQPPIESQVTVRKEPETHDPLDRNHIEGNDVARPGI